MRTKRPGSEPFFSGGTVGGGLAFAGGAGGAGGAGDPGGVPGGVPGSSSLESITLFRFAFLLL